MKWPVRTNWPVRTKRRPESGDQRRRVIFALLPRRCGRVWVWLERVLLIEEYRRISSYDGYWEGWVVIECREVAR